VFNAANDPNLFWPQGKRLLSDPAVPLKILVQEIDKFWTDTSTDANFPFGVTEVKKAASILPLFMSIMSCPDLANANDIERKKIEWVIQMTDSFDKMDLLLSKNEAYSSAPENYRFTPEDKNILAWNIYHEARGESDIGKKLVLLTVINRMLSPHYPASVRGVVFKHRHFTWANRILDQDNFLGKESPSNQEVSSFLKIREMIETIVQGKNITELKSHLLRDLGLDENLANITNYHVYGMWETPEMRTKYKWSENTVLTRKRLLVVDWLSKNSNQYSQFIYHDPTGRHIFYTNTVNREEIINSIFNQLPENIKAKL
jgi:hypothetical protein